MRVEQIRPVEARRRYPVCIGGRRAVPPEGCGGPWAFLELRQQHSAFHIAKRLVDLFDPIRADDERDDERSANVTDGYEQLVALLCWVKIDRFDRRAANCQLAQVGMSALGTAA